MAMISNEINIMNNNIGAIKSIHRQEFNSIAQEDLLATLNT